MNLSKLLKHPIVLRSDDKPAGDVWDVAIHPANHQVLGILSELEMQKGRALCFLPHGRLEQRDRVLVFNACAEELNEFSVNNTYGKDQAVSLENLPPVVVGPFGYTVSPSMMAAVLNAQLKGTDHGASAPGNGVWFSELIDLPVFDASGEIGHCKDIVLDADTFECKTLVLETAHHGPLHVPFKAVRNVPEDMTHIVIQESNAPF